LSSCEENTTQIRGNSEFLVRVLFRQNASWQGEIHWIDQDKKKYFKSVLELIMLMQSAMDEAGKPVAEYSFQSLEDHVGIARKNRK